MRVKYTGPLCDYSGYGEAARHDVAALVEAGVTVTTEIPHYTIEIADFGPMGAIGRGLENNPIGYQVKIIHTTPNVIRQYLEPGKYHVGRVFWETNKLPLEFATGAQMCDEIWTGSQYNADAIRAAGVTKPIYIIPEAIDTNVEPFKPYLTANDGDYRFYSIFEWTERKNPAALLEAYWREFEGAQGVSLTLKTYVDNFQPHKKTEIDQKIKKLQKRLRLRSYAPIYLYRQLMDRRQIYRLHTTFDCYVSPHRGEGWGIPQMEALLMGNPIISTGAGGIHEYLTHMQDAYLLPYKMAPVNNNRNTNWYTPDQQWADVSIPDLRKAMRWVFENQKQAKAMGDCGKLVVKNKFNLKTVGGLMNQRLLEIRKSLEPKATP
jgi:glycosyltransferase involved in cell wall biosynthesis